MRFVIEVESGENREEGESWINLRAEETGELVRSHPDTRGTRVYENVFPGLQVPYNDQSLKRFGVYK